MELEEMKNKLFADSFWNFIAENHCYQPSAILKQALNDKKRDNQLGIKKLTRSMLEDCGSILSYVRGEMFQNMTAAQRSKIYGKKYENNADTFLFENGELDTIEELVQEINANKHFFDDLKPILNNITKNFSQTENKLNLKRKYCVENETEEDLNCSDLLQKTNDNMEEVKSKLEKAICKIRNIEMSDKNKMPIGEIDVEFNRETLSFTASFKCPDCSKKLLSNKKNNGYWMLSNFTRHVKTYHSKREPYKGEKKTDCKKSSSTITQSTTVQNNSNVKENQCEGTFLLSNLPVP